MYGGCSQDYHRTDQEEKRYGEIGSDSSGTVGVSSHHFEFVPVRNLHGTLDRVFLYPLFVGVIDSEVGKLKIIDKIPNRSMLEFHWRK